MTAFRNGILQKTSTPKYSDLQLRASAILEAYESACAWAAVLQGRFAYNGDDECAAIAATWYAALKPRKRDARRVYDAVNAHQTRKNCDAYVARHEEAWEATRD